jgi:hypothetical protein
MADGGRRDARPGRGGGDARRDFFSRSFDAAAALLGPRLTPPVPSAPAADNVAACRRLLPRSHPAALGPRAPPRPPAPARARRDADERGRRPRLIDEIAERAGGSGPLAPLLRAYQAKGRVRVTTRHARGVRGVAEGSTWGRQVQRGLAWARRSRPTPDPSLPPPSPRHPARL